MAANKLGSVWSSMKTIVGLQDQQSNRDVSIDGFNSNNELASAFNCFYNRFNTVNFDTDIQQLKEQLEDSQHLQYMF